MENGIISMEQFHPIARLSGGSYAPIGKSVHLKKYSINPSEEGQD
jgi:hypothetical protein